MFDQIIRASEALSASFGHQAGALIPGLWGCKDCGTSTMIASPAWASCKDCGQELTVLNAPASPQGT